MISLDQLLHAKGQSLPSLAPADPSYAGVHVLAGPYLPGELVHCRNCGQPIGTAKTAENLPPSYVYAREGVIQATRPKGVRFAVPCYPRASLN